MEILLISLGVVGAYVLSSLRVLNQYERGVMVGQAMHGGAFGLSTGLRYIPGFYSKTNEVVALSTVAADSGGIYTSHLREEGLGLFEGVGEALEIGRQAHIPVVLTHHKAIGQKMWGKSTVTLHMSAEREVGRLVRLRFREIRDVLARQRRRCRHWHVTGCARLARHIHVRRVEPVASDALVHHIALDLHSCRTALVMARGAVA